MLNEVKHPAIPERLFASIRVTGLETVGGWLWREAVWVVGWLALGMLARLWAFGWFPLREDEALYAYWARLVSSGLDPMLEHVAVDKPPLFIYMLARFFTWFGPTLTSGRLLNELCSLLALVLLWALARRVYGPGTARIALALFALSPFAISFAPTVYVDPMLVAWLLLALLAASFGLGLGAGLALGMAFATKQSAVLFIPLVAGALLLGAPPVWWRRRQTAERGQRAEGRERRTENRGRRTAGIIVPLVAAGLGLYYIWFKVWQWDGWRILPAEIPDFWRQSWNTYGGVKLMPLTMWVERLRAWSEVWRWLGGWAPGTVVLIGLTLIAVAGAIRQLRAIRESPLPGFGHPSPATPGDHGGSPLPATSLWTLLFAGYMLVYILVHAAFSFQAWDRYLLPLAPLLALLAGRGLEVLWLRGRGQETWRWGLTVALVAVLAWGAGQAVLARIPVGGDHGAYAGIEQVASYLHRHVPAVRGVLYQRWLGWHWDWYLWDGPRGRVYWSDPAMIVADLHADPLGYERYVVFPGWQEAERPALEAALAPYHLRLEPGLTVRRADGGLQFTVYQFVREASR